MKSCFFLVGMSLIWVNAQAQSTSAPAKAAATPAATTPANPTPPKTDPKLTFLYTEGQITTEGVLNIQLMNAPLGIVFDELKFRYFKSGEMAYRARGFIKMNTSNAKINGSNNKSATIIENNKDYFD